jgi:hypothetical protein
MSAGRGRLEIRPYQRVFFNKKCNNTTTAGCQYRLPESMTKRTRKTVVSEAVPEEHTDKEN